MKSDKTYLPSRQEAGSQQKSKTLVRHMVLFSAVLLLSTTAHAQYGGGGGTMGTPTAPGTYTPSSGKSYGNGKAIGIGIGAAAAGAGAIYLMTHRSSKVTGCVETANDGLRLTDDKSNRTLALVPGNSDIKPGERLELKGKIKKNAAGEQNFLVKAVDKDLGSCSASASAAPPDSPAAR